MRSLLLNGPYWSSDPEKAAELLGRDFRDDERIQAELAREYPSLGLRAVWALCEIWPESPDLAREYEAVRHEHLTMDNWLVRDLTEMNLICTLATPEEVLFAFLDFLRDPRPRWQYFAEKVRGPILRRVGSDQQLQELLWNRLKSSSIPSEQVSFALLLGEAAKFAQELRDWCRDKCDEAHTEAVAPVGTDVLSGAVLPVREVAAELLFRDVGL
jgi:hypothetical protein